MNNSAFDRGLETADEWFAAVAKRLDANRPYLVPARAQAILTNLSQNERQGFVEGLAAIIVASHAWGPASPGVFRSADAYRLMQMTPAEQQAEDHAFAQEDALAKPCEMASVDASDTASAPKARSSVNFGMAVYCLKLMEERAEELRALASAIENSISAEKDPTARTLARLMREASEDCSTQRDLYQALGITKLMEQGDQHA